MKTWSTSLIMLVAWSCPAWAQTGSLQYQTLTIYVTPADLDVMRVEPDGILVTVPDAQRGRVKNVIVFLDTSGAPGTPYVRYRPNDPEYRNRALPVLAAEFDAESLHQLRNAPLGMVFEAPPEAVDKITHVNIRLAPSITRSPQSSLGSTAANTPITTAADQGLPPRQPAFGNPSPPAGTGLGGWNMESASPQDPAFNRLTPGQTHAPQPGLNPTGSGSNLTPLESRNNIAPAPDHSFNSWQTDQFRQPPVSQAPPPISQLPPQYGSGQLPLAGREAVPGWGYQNQPNPTVNRREMDDRLMINQMQSYLFDLESRVAQLTNELQWEKTRRQAAANSTVTNPVADTATVKVQEVSSQVPASERTSTSDGSLPRINGFLWFMLLCSIGINLYLAWISRGFYMRYAELADELRETFARNN